jgi:hypothetical protein
LTMEELALIGLFSKSMADFVRFSRLMLSLLDVSTSTFDCLIRNYFGYSR